MTLNKNHELDLEFIRKEYPLTDEERRTFEEQFNKEEAALRDTISSRTERQRKQISEFISALFMDDLMEELGFTKKL